MMTKSQKIIFFGTEQHSLETLRALVENGFNVVAVVTKPDSVKGRGRKLSIPPVKEYATRQNIAVWQPEKLREITEDIRSLQPVAGVLVSYGKIIPQLTIDLFSPGVINVHPSLLPKLRGPSPIESAISGLLEETGITIMKLDARMDSGPIYAQQKFNLNGNESKYELYDSLFGAGNNLLAETLPKILSGELQPVEQDDSEATYCSMLTKDMSIIDPRSLTAKEADARIRAHLGFPKSRLSINEHEIIVTKARISETAELPISIEFRDGRFLIIEELVAPSGKTMSAEAFSRGYLQHSDD